MLKSMTVRATLVAIACAISFSAHALADAPRAISIPAGDLRQGLLQLSREYGVELVYQPEAVSPYRTQGVRGTYEAKDAVRLLLKGTPLELRTDPSGAMLIADPRAAGASTQSTQANPQDDQREGSKNSSKDRLQLAQVDQGQTSSPSTVEGQDQQTSKEKVVSSEGAISEILIKGSRIMNVDVKRTEDDVQPYYILESKQIEQSGATNVEDFLKQQLPMNTSASDRSQIFNGRALTISSINLRGLGTRETLVLIDGRRSAATLGLGGQPDLNGIPLSAIERIEVLPSSASAIYGGAAVGGVVNVILKKDFSGGEVRYSDDAPFKGHAPLQTVSATYGFSLWEGKTRVMLTGSYSDGEPLRLSDRLDIVQRGISNILRNSPSFLYNSSNPFQGATPNIACQDANGNPTNCVLLNGTSLNSPITSIPAGAAPGSNLSAGLIANAGTYNLNPAPGTELFGLQNELGVTPRQKSVGGTLRQELTADLEAFTEASTASNAGRQECNPYGGAQFVPAGAPDNPFQQAVNISFPTTLSAPCTSDSVTQSATVGLIAKLPREWRSEIDYTWSQNSILSEVPQLDTTAFQTALAAGTVNPFADTVAYPLNLAPYVGTESTSFNTSLNDLGLRASGPIGTLPWGRPTLTIGLEHRKEGSHDSDDLLVFPLTPTSNVHEHLFGQSQSTDSVYAEAQVPLVTTKNSFPGVESLDLQLAGRSERYTVHLQTSFAYYVGGVLQSFSPPQGVHQTVEYTSTNPTIGLKFRPVEDVMLRASYATAFLPPRADQLLLNPRPICGFPCVPITDPQNGQTYTVDFTSGGNPSLKPQTSRDWDFGVVWEPQEEFLKGLRLDVQYYKIEQPNYIAYPSAQQAVGFGRVTRDPLTGRITVVDESPINATEYRTAGWDFRLNFSKPTSWGTFSAQGMATIVLRDQRQYRIGSPFLDYVGFPMAASGEARTKANLTLGWEYRHWTLGWTTTYVSNYMQVGVPGDPLNTTCPGCFSRYLAAQGGPTIPAQTYHDLFGSYTFSGAGLLSNLFIQFGIYNLFNTVPPFDAYGSYYYSTFGDPRLRTYRITLKKSF